MPQLETLKIEHYKGFFEEETLEFAVPDGRPGSGLTLIVGPNNAGKTTLLEALLLGENGTSPGTKEKRFRASERHSKSEPRITINDCVYSNVGSGAAIKKVNQFGHHGIDFKAVLSRRLWDHTSDTSIDLEAFSTATRQQDMRGTKISNYTASALKDINEDQTQKDHFNLIMAQIIPRFADWTIDSDDQGYYVKYLADNSEHGANLLGEGVMSAFHICIHILNVLKNDGVLIIDEPELSLHPTAQKSLSSILRDMSKNKQIVLCTHSPYFVNWQDFLDGAHFIRLNKSKNGKNTISSLSEKEKYSSFISSNLYEWQKPQLLDVAAKEILFAEKVLFVEGQEDVGLIRTWGGNKLNFDIFGYGVGGYCNIRLLLQMAQDLGIKRVGALYDSGKDAGAFFEEDQYTFSSPSFLLQKLPTEDIRDKNPNAGCVCGNCTCDTKYKKPKEGCFDEHGELKEKWSKKFSDIMIEFMKFFNSA